MTMRYEKTQDSQTTLDSQKTQHAHADMNIDSDTRLCTFLLSSSFQIFVLCLVVSNRYSLYMIYTPIIMMLWLLFSLHPNVLQSNDVVHLWFR